MRRIQKTLAIVVLCSVTLTMVAGCNLANLGQTLLNQIQIDQLLNTESLQLIDIAGQPNRLIPDYPNYDKDPLCIIPGFCGPNIWYPFSSGEAED